MLAARPADVILLDFDLGGERGTEFLVHARGMRPAPRVLVLTAGVSDADALHLLALGACGIFLKHHPPELLASIIRTVMRGEAWLDQRYLAALARGPQPVGPDGRARLTDRERDVLRLLLEGLANKEIGGRLGISEGAVKTALQQLFDKFSVRTRSQLVRIALERLRDQL